MGKHRRRHRGFRLACATLTAVAACVPVTAAANTAAGAQPDVVGGTEASIRDYPYAVFLTDQNGNQFCGGVLITASAVATAAHCVAAVGPANIRVVAGREDKRTDSGVLAQVASVWTAPGFSDPARGDDVAVLRLTRSLPYRPATLPASNDGTPYVAGTNATVLGWGRIADGGERSQVLRRAVVPVVSDTSCAASYPSYNATSMVCAGYPQGGVDACQGDSGGPLLVGETLIGIVSWGEGCARPGKPGVYTRVSTYADDIRAQSGA